MNSKFLRIATLGSLGLLMSASAQAALFDRGGGLIYDNVLDVTWLQDASYLHTSNGVDSAVTWTTATQWASSLNYYDSVRATTLSDWRLPHMTLSYDLGTDVHYNDASVDPGNELAYMYYVNLGFPANPVIDPNQPETTPLPVSSNPDNLDLFQNINYLGTWTDQVEPIEGRVNTAWYFHLHFGSTQLDTSGSDWGFAWAVMDGDVSTSPVPVPPALLLMGSGMALLGFMGKKRKA
ncbi:MAG: hypothetical protein ABW076_14010 [Candidatus Thiodiazotropha sp.]